MARLALFGGASLSTDDGPLSGRSAQRRRLALLSVLAAERRALTREKLIGWVWPETEPDKARRLLSESLYVLRKELGEDAVAVNGEEVSLNAGVVGSDVADFHAAIAARRWADAVALYAGPFLDGFFIPDAGEFEHWVDARRDELARAYADALENLAADAARSGDAAGAAAAWRKRAAQDPYDGRVALILMRALAAAGNREAALQHARVHASLLQSEFGAEPAPDLLAYAEELRDAPPPAGPRPTPVAAVEPVAPTATPSAPIAATPVAVAPLAGSSAAPGLPAFLSGYSRRQQLAAAVVVLTLGAAAVTASTLDVLGRSGETAVSADVTMVAVLPFTVLGAPEYVYLGEGLASLLGTSLNGAGSWRSVDLNALLSHPVAEAGDVLSPIAAGRLAADLGARHYVLGSVVETGGVFRITAALYENGVETVQASVEGREVEIPDLVDALSRQLLAGRMTGSGERLTRVASSTTASLDALKAYLAGDRDFRAARYRRAAESFASATTLDQTFALAHYRLSAASAWSFDFMTAHRASAEALENASRLSARDQELISAWHAFLEGDADRAERLYESIVTRTPNDVEAWSGLGEVRAHYNTVRGRPLAEATAAFERVLELAPDYGEARFHMMEQAAERGDRIGFDSLFADVDPANEQATAWSAVRAIAWGTAAERESALERLRGEDEVITGIAAARLAVNFRDFDAATSTAQLLTVPERTADWRAAGHILLAQLAVARGDMAQADRQIDAALPLERDWAMEMRGLLALHPLNRDDRARLERARADIAAWNPGAASPSLSFFFATHADVHAQLRVYLLALIDVRLGDADSAERMREELMRGGRSTETRAVAVALSQSVDAHARAARGDLRRALGLLDEARLTASLERVALSSFFSQALDRRLRAEIHEQLGESAEAARWYGSLMEGADIMFAAEAAQRRATLSRR